MDELITLAVILGAMPTDLLSYVPEDAPLPEHLLTTGVPGDVDPLELRAWLEGRTGLNHESRLAWARDRVEELAIKAAYVDDQLRAAQDELNGLGELAEQEADALPVLRLHDRIHEGEYDLSQMISGLTYAE